MRITHYMYIRPKERLADPILTYIDLLKQDTGLEEPDIKIAMLDISVWMAGHYSSSCNVST